MASSNDSRGLYPVLAMLAGATMWGVVWYPMRLLENGGLQGVWLSLILYATALIVSLPRTWRVVGEFSLAPATLVVLTIASGWTNVAFIEAVLNGNVLRVLLLFYLSPLWATLLAWLLLGERISRTALMSLFLAMAGAIVMLWNTRLGAPWPQGYTDWMALTSGFAFALSNVMTRKAQQVSLTAKVMCVWSGVILVALAMIAVLAIRVPQIDLPVFSGAVALGIGGVMLMTIFVQYGVTHMPVYRSAVLALVELVAGAVSQQLLTNEIVTFREWVGGVFILVGAYLAACATRSKP